MERLAKSWMLLASTPIATLAACVQPVQSPLETSAQIFVVGQGQIDRFARSLDVQYQVVDNSPEKCPTTEDNCFLTTLTFTTPEEIPDGINSGDVSIYFSFVDRLPRIESDVFNGELVNGDLHRLTVKPGADLAPSQTYFVQLWGLGSNFSEAFAMPNFYVAGAGVSARVIEATRTKIDPETGLETRPFVVSMIDRPDLATKDPADQTIWQAPEIAFAEFAARGPAMISRIAIIPTPAVVQMLPGEPIDLSRGVSVTLSGVEQSDVEAGLMALVRSGVSGEGGAPLGIRVDPSMGLVPESYQLMVDKGRVEIIAADRAGANHALQSLAQQALHDKGKLVPFTVKDQPRYPFRGLHIDLARNFHSKQQVLKLIDAMAAYKLNKLHLHLADDEGWRLEIKALPELTKVGSRRCHDLTEQTCLLPQLGAGPDGDGAVNGYFSQFDYIEIVRAAAAHNIEIIPSLDMPGHSRAAIRSMEARYRRLAGEGKPAAAEEYRLVEPGDTTQYRSIQNYNDNTLNVCIDQTYRFLDTAVDEISAMHRLAGAPLRTFHIGADETAGAWKESPACIAVMATNNRTPKELSGMFIERVANGLASKGIKVAGWSDGIGHTDPAKMPAAVQTNIWATLFENGVVEAHSQANHGWDVVLSIPDLGYFDMPYVPHPQEGGYNWATRGVDTKQVFAFMTDNLPANAASIKNKLARKGVIEDSTPRSADRDFVGLQAQLWSETTRTDSGVDYQLFPRLIALAERAWHRPEWEPAYQPGQSYEYDDHRVDQLAIMRDWNGFSGRMPTQLKLLDRLKIAYRVTPPGARIIDGRFEANSEYPGQLIEYRVMDGTWLPYEGPVAVSGLVDARTRSSNGERTSRIVTVRPKKQ